MLLLDAISEVELFVSVFADVYVLVLLLYIILSWIRIPPSLGPLQRFLYDVCEPYLRFWRRSSAGSTSRRSSGSSPCTSPRGS
jgi:uncharacterized protein YggT (Ycf19 family)